MKIERRTKIILFAIILIGVLFRFYYFSLNNGGLTLEALRYPDEQTYYGIATEIKGLDFFKSESSLYASILQPIFIALLNKNILLIKIISIFLGGLSIYLTYETSKLLFKNELSSLLSGFVVAIHPDLIEYSTTLLTENNFLILNLLFFLFLIKSFATPSKKNIISASVFFILATLQRPSSEYFLFFLFPLFVLFIIFKKNDAKIMLKTLGIISVIAYSVLLVFHVKNYYYFDKLYLTTGKGAALFLGSDLKYDGDEPPLRGGSYDRINKSIKNISHLSIKGDAILTEISIKNIKKNFSTWLIMDIEKIGRLLYGNSYYWKFNLDPDKNGNITNGNELFQYFRLLLNYFIVSIGLIGIFLVFIKQNKLIHLPFIALILYTILIYSLTFSIPRYFYPIYPIIIIYGSYLFIKIATWRHERQPL